MKFKLLLTVFCAFVLFAHASPEDPRFRGKIVIVTGGTSGIGNQTALKFAQEGATVVVAGRRWEWGKRTEHLINKDPWVIKNAGKCRYFQADVSNHKDVKELVSFTTKTFGTLDIAANNAGLGGYLGRIADIPDDIPFSVHDPLQNNIYAVFFSMMEEIRYWTKSKRDGIIVNTASVNGMGATPMASMYGASKHAIIGLTKSVAVEYVTGPPKVRINAICPGLTQTPLTWNQTKYKEWGEQMWEGPVVTRDSWLWKKYEHEYEAILPNHRLAEPGDQADAILFLASDEAKYISGTYLPVDMTSTA